MALRRKGKDAKMRLLNDVALFRPCTKSELARIASLVDEVEAPEGKTLTREGESGWEFFVVAEGKATARRGGRKVAEIGPGSFFGEMSLLDEGPRSATVIADTDMHLLVLSSRSFSSLIDEVPAVARRILRGMAERLRSSERAPTH
ncbi:MAG: cyclic nucleotide-binding domain-containing protein [Solirubrobacterales bacterium]